MFDEAARYAKDSTRHMRWSWHQILVILAGNERLPYSRACGKPQAQVLCCANSHAYSLKMWRGKHTAWVAKRLPTMRFFLVSTSYGTPCG